jgi:hypothetical protein
MRAINVRGDLAVPGSLEIRDAESREVIVVTSIEVYVRVKRETTAKIRHHGSGRVEHVFVAPWPADG